MIKLIATLLVLFVAAPAHAQTATVASAPTPVVSKPMGPIETSLVGKECRAYFEHIAYTPNDASRGALWMRRHADKGWGLWIQFGQYARVNWEGYKSYNSLKGPSALTVVSDGSTFVLDGTPSIRYTLTPKGNLHFDMQMKKVDGEQWKGEVKCF